MLNFKKKSFKRVKIIKNINFIFLAVSFVFNKHNQIFTFKHLIAQLLFQVFFQNFDVYFWTLLKAEKVRS